MVVKNHITLGNRQAFTGKGWLEGDRHHFGSHSTWEWQNYCKLKHSFKYLVRSGEVGSWAIRQRIWLTVRERLGNFSSKKTSSSVVQVWGTIDLDFSPPDGHILQAQLPSDYVRDYVKLTWKAIWKAHVVALCFPHSRSTWVNSWFWPVFPDSAIWWRTSLQLMLIYLLI